MAATYTKPVKTPEWNSGGANRVEPLAAKKILGHAFAVIPSSAEENWRASLVDEWMRWFDERLADGFSTDENDFDLYDPGNAEAMIRLGGNQISFVPENPAIDPLLQFDTGDSITYDRTANRWIWKVSGSDEVFLDSSGVWVPGGGLSVGSTTSMPQPSRVTAAKTGSVNSVALDANDAAVGKLLFGNGSDDDSIRVTHATGVFSGYSNAVLAWFFNNTDFNFVTGVSIGSGLAPAFPDDLRVEGGINIGGAVNPTTGNGIFTSGLSVGHDAQPIADSLTVGAATFGLDFSTANPEVRFNGALNVLRWDVAVPGWDFLIGGVSQLAIEDNRVTARSRSRAIVFQPTSTSTAPLDDRFEVRRTNILTARGNILSGGGVTGGHYNIATATRVSAGTYEITHDENLSNVANEANGVATTNAPLNVNCSCRYMESPDNFTEVVCFTANSGAKTDSGFTVMMNM